MKMFKDRTALAFIILLPLLLLVGYFKPQPLYGDQTESIRTRFWTLKVNRADKFDLILVGDSRVYRGISPTAMQSVLLETRILNFGFSSGGLNSEMYALVEQRLAPDNPHPVIVLGITPHSLTPRSIPNDQYHDYHAKPAGEQFAILHLTGLGQFFQPISPKDILEKNAENELLQEYYDDGWVASWYPKDNPNSAIQVYSTIFDDNQVSPELVDGLIAQTEAWTQDGILVFGFRPPSTLQMVDIENQLSGFDEASLQDAFKQAGGIWLDFPPDAYRSYDGSHLHKEGAIDFSVDLAKLIQPYLTTPAE